MPLHTMLPALGPAPAHAHACRPFRHDHLHARRWVPCPAETLLMWACLPLHLQSLGADIDHMTGEVAACEALLDAVQRETQQYQVALEQAHAVETSSRDHCLSVCSEEEGLEALVALRVGGPRWQCDGAAVIVVKHEACLS